MSKTMETHIEKADWEVALAPMIMMNFTLGLAVLVPGILTILARASIGSSLLCVASDDSESQADWLDGFDGDSDAYKILFEEIYKPGGDNQPNPSRILIGSAFVGMQMMVVGIVLSYYNGWLGSQYGWAPVHLDRDDLFSLFVREFAGYLLLFVTWKEFARSTKLMRFAATHPGNICGQVCAWMLALIGFGVAFATVCIGCIIIVSSESVIDVLKDFVALAFITDIDDWAGAMFPVNKTQWLATLPRDAAQHVVLKTLNMLVVFAGFAADLYFVFVWIPMRSLAPSSEHEL